MRSLLGTSWAESDEATSIASMLKAHQQLLEMTNRTQLAMGQGKFEAMGRAYDMLKTDESAQQADLMVRLQKLVNDQQEKTNEEIQALADASHAATLSLWTTTFLGIFAGCLIAFVISKRISISLGALLDRARAISSGDLSGHELISGTDDEIGDLMSAMNEMQSRLREMIVAVAQMSGDVATSSEDLAAGSATT